MGREECIGRSEAGKRVQMAVTVRKRTCRVEVVKTKQRHSTALAGSPELTPGGDWLLL